VRVTTAFKRPLRVPGASVIDVSFTAEGVIITVHLRRRRRICAHCGQTGHKLEIHDRGVKRWRHLDVAANRCVIECELRRLRCPDCGVRLEPAPWARPGAAHTRDFEDVVASLAQQMPFAAITRSRGCSGLGGTRSGRSSPGSLPTTSTRPDSRG
jgi:transposase